MATITVNGNIQQVELPLSVLDLIKKNNVQQPDMVSVQINENFVNRDQFPTLQIREGDTVDFLYFMGGGNIG